MTVSSNFWEYLSLLVSGIFLPFYQWHQSYLIILNLVYDLSCIALPLTQWIKDFLRNCILAKSITRFWWSDGSDIFCSWIFLTFILLILSLNGDNRSNFYIHGAESAVGFIACSKRLVYFRVHVVADHGYPYAVLSQYSFTKSSSLPVSDDLIGCSSVTFLPYSPLASLHLTP